MSEPTRDDFDAAIAVILAAYRADRERLRRLEAYLDAPEETPPPFNSFHHGAIAARNAVRALLRGEA